ncbi:histidine phosphatase superfamily [Ampelomyces quisqualis]|uniref:Histidine phosphatase superfamily n=1 Tax=Ampelomyces quisqualis TaxID=50730 RepID=A0A6A5QHT7_AMPQU|nr:histidine phosphatase superfamily [Ampelomyces quisqualis]
MLIIALSTLASAWLVGAQEVDSDLYHPHAAFAFVRSGERTPTLQDGTPVLTALGAQQMFTLGQNLRTRYISGNAPAGLGVQRIAGMSEDGLDNNQIMVQTSDQQHLISSAQAFMQGLYPPRNIANSNGTQGSAGGLLSNGSAIDYPLGGYQYANILSSGQHDPKSIYVAGSQNCPVAQRDAMMYYRTNKFQNTRAANQAFYSSLNVDWFEGNLNESTLDYINAMGIYDYLQYQYAHNSNVHRALANDSAFTGVYDKVRTLADEQAWYFYGNTSASSTDADNQAIPGKTLAASILGSFQKVIVDRMSPGNPTDMSYPLTFFFGEQEPIVSLVSLMMVDYMDYYFRSIPRFGSAMIFELFSRGANSTFPSTTNALWVRFHFHNGTDFDNGQLTAFPIFGNGPSRTDMSWKDFQDLMSRIMMSSIAEWCNACNSASLFCHGVDGPTSSLTSPSAHKSHSPISPAVGGVIGAIVTLAIAGLIFALAMLLGGLRFHRVQRHAKSELGGFKGSAKLASDPDLSLAKNAALPAGISFVPESNRWHERVGSWELRQKEFGGARQDTESMDGIAAIAAQPVQPEERV